MRLLFLVGLLTLAIPAEAGIRLDTASDFCVTPAAAVGDLPTGDPVSVGAWIQISLGSLNKLIFSFGERIGSDSGFAFRVNTAERLSMTTWAIKDYNSLITVPVTEVVFVAFTLDASHDTTFYLWVPSTDTLTTQVVTHSADMNNPVSGGACMFIGAQGRNSGSGCDETVSHDDIDIHEIMFYDTDFSQDDWERIFRSKIHGMASQVKPDNLVGHWLLDEYPGEFEMDGFTVFDRSQNANDMICERGLDNAGMTGLASPVLSHLGDER